VERRRKRKKLSAADQDLLNRLRSTFHQHSRGKRMMNQTQLNRFLGIKSRFISRRLFHLFDSDGDGRLSYDDFFNTVKSLILGEERVRLQFIFDLHDQNRDGAIGRQELDRMITACLLQNSISMPDSERRRMVNTIVRTATGDARGKMDYRQFSRLLSRFPEVRKELGASISAWLTGRPVADTRRGKIHIFALVRRVFLWIPYVVYRYLLFTAYVAANIYLAYLAVMHYRAAGANIYIQIARGAGACLNLNGALILVPMMRSFITWVKRTFLARVVPTDQHVQIHKLIGHAMFFFALVHSGAHLGNYVTTTPSLVQSLFYTYAGLTGFILLVVFLIMWLFALNGVRKSGHFEWFFFTHLLYPAWLAGMLLHGPVFWKWAAVPILGFLVERIYRRLAKRHPSYVSNGKALSTGVTSLELHRPDDFQFRPGDYLFLKVPRISRFEWHPFTISSAPEESRHIDLHIRKLGNWTGRLHKHFRGKRKEDRKAPVVIDGPYGTPSAKILTRRQVILVGAGIGVTPFTSVLHSIMLRNKKKEPAGPEKIVFYWLNRGQRSFDWFTGLLREVESARIPELVETNIYMTDAKINATTGIIKVGMELVHRETGTDGITGLTSQTKFGRPAWGPEFERLSRSLRLSAVDVFFCGPFLLGRAVRRAAGRYGFRFHQEVF